MNATLQASVSERKRRAALWSIAASAAITIAKGAAGLATGSLALLSDAVHSLLDVASTTLTWLAVRAADKPADAEHHYGHGKFESLAALVETAFLFLLSGAVAYEGLRRLVAGQADVQPSLAAAAVLVGAILVDAWRWWSLRRVARETKSEALEADALHFSSDLINSVLVLAALGAAALGYTQADSLVAIGVSLFIAVAGFRLARRTIDALLDAAPKGLAEAVRTRAAAVPGVVSVERVRVRAAGGATFGEVGVRVSRTLPLERVAALRERVAQALREDMPGADILVTAEPTSLDDESLLERVLLIAAKRRTPVHHVMVQDVAGRLTLSLDLEVDGRMSLGAAHQRATRLEAAILEELGPEVEIDTHIEPLRVSPLAGEDAEAAVAEPIAAALAGTAAAVGQITGIHSVRVRRTADGLVVNYHCLADPSLTVANVHAQVDELERRVRAAHPEIMRVVGHAEPAGRG
ncbi:MAG TPA: cation diffusion facilitator family transporter [Beijerinckiaceae bacterium]|jgi:cation diffusion facilitator family transporter